MAKEKRKILVLVEGARTDVALLERLLSTYQIDIKYEIVPYCTNIYTLYHEMFEDNDPASMDLLQLLKSREPNLSKKALFDDSYSDILLIFDLERKSSVWRTILWNHLTWESYISIIRWWRRSITWHLFLIRTSIPTMRLLMS